MHNSEWSQSIATRGISLNVDKIPPHEVLNVDHICSFLSHYRKAVLAKLTLVRQSFAMILFDFNFYSVIKRRTMCLTTNKAILQHWVDDVYCCDMLT